MCSETNKSVSTSPKAKRQELASAALNVVTTLARRNWDFPDAKTENGVHSIHPYPAKFIGEIPRSLIQDLGVQPGTAVLDPFCGCGTTLVEAQQLGLPSIGIDLNPIACLITRVKTTPLPARFLEAASRCADEARRQMRRNVSTEPVSIPNVNHWFDEGIQVALNSLLSQITLEENPAVSDALRMALSSILVRVSNQDSDTRYAAVKKNLVPSHVFELFFAACRKVHEVVPPEDCEAAPAKVVEKDILQCTPEDIGSPVGLIITSPPYPNAYEYWLYHKYRMWWLGHDPILVKKHEIGARAHFFKKDHHTEKDFFRQMSGTLNLLTSVVTSGGYVCIVIGRSRIHGQYIDNATIIKTIARSLPLTLVSHVDRVIAPSRKSFNLHHARIKKESVLVFVRG